jgi:hypothetical protein
MRDEAERSLELLVALTPEPGADAEEVERSTRRLRAELRELDVDDVAAVSDGTVPPGAKGIDPASLSQLLVSMTGAGGVVATVVAAVRDWLGRRRSSGKVTLTIDGDTLELSSATAGERSELVDAFVRRHSAV